MNLESFRQRCINRITETYNNLANLDTIFAEEERNILVEIQNDDTIANKDQAFNFARQSLNEQKSIMTNRIIEALRRDIRICARELSRLATDREIYEYYRLVTTMPSSGDYNRYLNMSLSEFESNVFREYIMSEPRLENIIISYSELEAYNLENNSDNDDEPENDQDGNDEPEEDEPENDQDGNDEPEEDEPENDQDGNDEPEEDEPENDQDGNDEPEDDEIDEEDEFERICRAILYSLDNNREVPQEAMDDLQRMYIERLENNTLSNEQNALYREVVRRYNIYVHGLNQNEFVTSRRGRFSVFDGIVEIFGKGVSLIRGTRAYKTRCLRKITEANNENNQEKRSRYIRLLTDQDIVCNLTRMRRENTIESLNYRLVRDNGLSQRRTNRLYRTAERYANSLERKLDRKIQRENEIFESGARSITVLNQYLEVLGNINCYETKLEEFESLLNELRQRDLLNDVLYNIYHTEAQNIVNYRNAMNGSIYIIDLNDIVELTNHYQDSEIVTRDIPFIKRRHI